MKSRTKKISLDKLYIFIYLWYVVVRVLGATQFSLIEGWPLIRTATNYLTVLFLVIILFGKKINTYSLFLIGIFIVIGGISSLTNEKLFETGILVLFIVNGNNVKNDRFLLSYVKTVSVLVAVTIILSKTGIYYSDYRYGTNGEIRQYLGFLSATHSSNYFFHLVLAYVGQKKKNLTVKESIIILALNFYFFCMTNTKAVFYYTIALIVFLWLFQWWPKLFKNKLAKTVIPLIMPVSAISSIAFSYFYNPNNSFLFKLDSLLSYRLRLARQAIDLYGLPLFGSDVTWQTGRYGIERYTSYLFVDTAFVNIILTYGIILLIFVVIGFSLMISMCIEQEKYFMTVALAFLSIHSFSDPQLLELRYNPYILFLFSAFLYFRNRRKTIKDRAVFRKDIRFVFIK